MFKGSLTGGRGVQVEDEPVSSPSPARPGPPGKPAVSLGHFTSARWTAGAGGGCRQGAPPAPALAGVAPAVAGVAQAPPLDTALAPALAPTAPALGPMAPALGPTARVLGPMAPAPDRPALAPALDLMGPVPALGLTAPALTALEAPRTARDQF